MANKKLCVLSIDGGGVRGVIPAQILQYLESCLQELDGPDVRIADYFETIAGTSTGGITAAMLAMPDKDGRPMFTAKRISDFYFANATKIFPHNMLTNISFGLLGPKYSEKPLEELLKKYLGDVKMKDTLVPVVIPAYDTKLQQPVLFSTSEAKSDESRNAYLRDVARGTSAAPTYFPPKYFETTKGTEFNLVDGGVAANNPTFVAIIQTFKDVFARENNSPKDLLKNIQDLLVISIGCGNQTVNYSAKEVSKWGALNWIINDHGAPLIQTLFNASSDMVDLSMSTLFHLGLCENNYLRIQTSKLDGNTAELDNSSAENLEALADVGKELLKEPVQRVNFLTGTFEPALGTETNKEAILRFAKWLSENRKATLQS